MLGEHRVGMGRRMRLVSIDMCARRWTRAAKTKRRSDTEYDYVCRNSAPKTEKDEVDDGIKHVHKYNGKDPPKRVFSEPV